MADIPLRVVRTGTGTPLLLINGLGAPLEMWDPLVRRLRGHEVIAFDLPGVGLSGYPQWPLRMPELARLVDRLLARLGKGRVDVLGYSFGGLLAQELAYRIPRRVRRLILGATMPGVPSVPPHPLVGLMLLTPARYYDRRLADWIVPLIAGGRTARDRRALDAGLVLRLARPPTTVGYLYQLYSLIGWSSHRWLHRLQSPTLVLHGDEDPVAPLVNGRYLAWAIPGARIHVIRGGGHLFIFDQPGSAVGVLHNFLEEAPFPAAA